MGKGDGNPGRPPRAPAGSQDGGQQPPRPTNGGVPLPARSRELVLQVPPTPPATAKDANGTAAPTTAGASSRMRSATRGLLVDSTPAVAAELTRPPCYLEKASLWSVLTFGYVLGGEACAYTRTSTGVV